MELRKAPQTHVHRLTIQATMKLVYGEANTHLEHLDIHATIESIHSRLDGCALRIDLSRVGEVSRVPCTLSNCRLLSSGSSLCRCMYMCAACVCCICVHVHAYAACVCCMRMLHVCCPTYATLQSSLCENLLMLFKQNVTVWSYELTPDEAGVASWYWLASQTLTRQR